MSTTTHTFGSDIEPQEASASAPLPKPAPKLDETALTRRAQAGDVEAFEQLMGLHVKRVRTFVAMRAPAEHLIDDITHETFVYAFRHLQDFTAGTALGAWLRAIASNLMRAEIQRFSREKANKMKLAEQLKLEQAETLVNKQRGDGHYLVEHLEHGIASLDEPMRQLLDLRYRLGLSTAAIAETTGRSQAWVRTTLFRVRQQLKDYIQRQQ